MSEIDISLLLQARPELLRTLEGPCSVAQAVCPEEPNQAPSDQCQEAMNRCREGQLMLQRLMMAVQMADSNPEDSEENSILSTEEITPHLTQANQAQRRQISILAQNRERLVGELEQSIEYLRSRETPEVIQSMVFQAAQRDGIGNELSSHEMDILLRDLRNNVEQNSPENFLRQTQELIRELEEIRRIRPEVFLPPSEAGQRTPINLNFFKILMPDEWRAIFRSVQIYSSGALSPNPPENAPNIPPEYHQAILRDVGIFNLISMAGIDPNDPEARNQNWDITVEDVENYQNSSVEYFQEQNPEGDVEAFRRQFSPIGETMADLRASAYTLWQEQINAAQHNGSLGTDLSRFAESEDDLRQFQGITTYLNAAGRDRILTAPEAELLVERRRIVDPTTQLDFTLVLQNADRLLSEERFNLSETMPANITNNSEFPDSMADRRTHALNGAVFLDLSYMINGYANSDREEMEGSGWGFLFNAVSWVGANTAFRIPNLLGWDDSNYANTTYYDYAREGVDMHRGRRAEVVQYLGRLIGWNFRSQMSATEEVEGLGTFYSVEDSEPLPQGPDRDFLRWLSTRPEGERQATLANGLEYMRTYPERYNQRIRSITESDLSREETEAYIEDLLSGDPERRDNIPEEHRDYVAFRCNKGFDVEANYHQAFSYFYSLGVERPDIVTRYYENLTGPFFRADRLWEIRSMTDPDEANTAWLEFAQELEDPIWSWFGSHTEMPLIGNLWGGETRWNTRGDGQGQFWWAVNTDFSQTIYHSLKMQSSNSEIDFQANRALQESLGLAITDRDGHVIEAGGGGLGLDITVWFNNHSVQERFRTIETLTMILPITRVARGALGLFRLGSSTMGRRYIGQRILHFLGMASTAPVRPTIARGAQGLFPRIVVDTFNKGAGRTVVTRTAQTPLWRKVINAPFIACAYALGWVWRGLQKVFSQPLFRGIGKGVTEQGRVISNSRAGQALWRTRLGIPERIPFLSESASQATVGFLQNTIGRAPNALRHAGTAIENAPRWAPIPREAGTLLRGAGFTLGNMSARSLWRGARSTFLNLDGFLGGTVTLNLVEGINHLLETPRDDLVEQGYDLDVIPEAEDSSDQPASASPASAPSPAPDSTDDSDGEESEEEEEHPEISDQE